MCDTNNICYIVRAPMPMGIYTAISPYASAYPYVSSSVMRCENCIGMCAEAKYFKEEFSHHYTHQCGSHVSEHIEKIYKEIYGYKPQSPVKFCSGCKEFGHSIGHLICKFICPKCNGKGHLPESCPQAICNNCVRLRRPNPYGHTEELCHLFYSR